MNLRRRLPILAAAVMLVLAVGCSNNNAEVERLRKEVEGLKVATPVATTTTQLSTATPTAPSVVAATATAQTSQEARPVAAIPSPAPYTPPPPSPPKIADHVVKVVQSCMIHLQEPGKRDVLESHVDGICDWPLRFGQNPVPSFEGNGGLWYIANTRTTITVRSDSGGVYEVVITPHRLVNVGDRWPPN